MGQTIASVLTPLVVILTQLGEVVDGGMDDIARGTYLEKEMKQQDTLMKFSPATGNENPYPSHAEQYRKYHGKVAWLYNPWTRVRRSAEDIGSDTFGFLVLPPGE